MRARILNLLVGGALALAGLALLGSTSARAEGEGGEEAPAPKHAPGGALIVIEKSGGEVLHLVQNEDGSYRVVPRGMDATSTVVRPQVRMRVASPSTVTTFGGFTDAAGGSASPLPAILGWMMQEHGADGGEATKLVHAWFAGGANVPMAGLRDALMRDGWNADRLIRWFHDHMMGSGPGPASHGMGMPGSHGMHHGMPPSGMNPGGMRGQGPHGPAPWARGRGPGWQRGGPRQPWGYAGGYGGGYGIGGPMPGPGHWPHHAGPGVGAHGFGAHCDCDGHGHHVRHHDRGCGSCGGDRRCACGAKKRGCGSCGGGSCHGGCACKSKRQGCNSCRGGCDCACKQGGCRSRRSGCACGANKKRGCGSCQGGCRNQAKACGGSCGSAGGSERNCCGSCGGDCKDCPSKGSGKAGCPGDCGCGSKCAEKKTAALLIEGGGGDLPEVIRKALDLQRAVVAPARREVRIIRMRGAGGEEDLESLGEAWHEVLDRLLPTVLVEEIEEQVEKKPCAGDCENCPSKGACKEDAEKPQAGETEKKPE